MADGYYGKVKFINGIRDLNLHLISKLRHDANLRWLYHGPQKLRGRRRQYDGKVGFLPQEPKRFENVGKVEGVQVYTAVVNSVQFKRNIRLVYLIKTVGQKIQTALLFSTDIELSALEIYRLYKARFQIEFLFRDAKQFTGLLDCQARCQAALHFHLNASMTALNLLKLEDRQLTGGNSRSVISIASWKIRKFNEHWLERFSSIFGLNFSLIKSSPEFETLCNYGAVAHETVRSIVLNGYKAIKGCKIPRIEFISLTRLIPNITQCPHKVGSTKEKPKQLRETQAERE